MGSQRPSTGNGTGTGRMRSWRWFALAVAAALIVVSCGGTQASPGQSASAAATVVASASPAESGSPAASESPSAPAGSPETSTIKLGLLPLADVAPVYLGMKEGFFEDEGLTIEIVPVQGGAAAIPALVNGELDITFGNYVSFFLASSSGIDLRIIADQNHATQGFSSIMTLPDSGISKPADLVGKKLAVNTLSNVAEITSRAQIKDAGADPDAVEYTEIPFPEMIAALEQGSVNAIFAVEPFATLAKQQLKAVEVVNPYGGRLDGFPVAGFQATTQFTEQNPNTVAAFQRAMVKASALAAEKPADIVAILPTYTTLTPELAATIAQPLYVSEIDVGKLKTVVDLMVEFGVIGAAPDLDSLVIPTS